VSSESGCGEEDRAESGRVGAGARSGLERGVGMLSTSLVGVCGCCETPLIQAEADGGRTEGDERVGPLPPVLVFVL
jgi:hypothetical protein